MAEKKMQRNLSLMKQALFSLIVVCSLLSLAEAAIRVWAYYFRTSYERYNPATGRLQLVPNIHYTTPNGNEFLINSKGFVGPEFDEHPRQGVYRIIALGDSCTFSQGFWKMAYPALLERLLNTHTSRRTFEVINAGIEGYNSTFALDRIQQEIIEYQPRLVTIYIGWNDLMKVNPSDVSSTGKYTFLAGLMEKSYLIKAYRKILFVYMRPLLFQPGTVVSEGDAHIFDSFVPAMYQANLESAIQVLRDNGVQALLFTLPTAVGPLMTSEELKRRNVFFPYFAGTYTVSKFLSLHRAYNNVIRSVGLKYNVPVVDLSQIFDSHNKDHLFWDTMHPSEAGHLLIAQSIFNKISEIEFDLPYEN